MSVASPSLKERLQAVKKTRWIRFGVAAVLFILFAVWLDNYYILPFLVVMADIYLTRYVPWTFWKKSKMILKFLQRTCMLPCILSNKYTDFMRKY